MTTALGAFIGTFYGSRKLYQYQQSGKIATRKVAIKAVEILKKYAGQPFSSAKSDFNISLSISEKRAILVALHKLGVPIIVPSTTSFQILDIQFSEDKISKEEMDSIIAQLDNGNCDYLFYADVENHFSSNLRLSTLRELAKRYVRKVMNNSRWIENGVKNPDNWGFKEFSPGELQAIMVFHYQMCDKIYYEDNGNLKSDIVDKLVTEIEIGLWDNYLFWDYKAYQNMRNQDMLVNAVFQMAQLPQQNNCNYNVKVNYDSK